MKALVLTLLFALLGGPAWADAGESSAQAAGRALVGTVAPPMKLETIDGDTIDLGALYGKKAVYLKFWGTWCVSCREQMPHFERVHRESGSDLAVIAINAGFNDTLEAVRDFRREHRITMPIVMDDGSLAEALDLRVTPQHVVIGRDGRVKYVGHAVNEQLESALQSARARPGAAVPAAAARHGVPGHGVGETLPAFSATTLDGTIFEARPAAADARVTALVFLSPWCESYLKTSRPALSASCRAVREEVSRLAGDARVRWLGIASRLWATPEDLRDYQREHAISIPLTLDESGELFRRFRVMHVPTVVLVDAQGRIVRRLEGSATSLAAELQAVAGTTMSRRAKRSTRRTSLR
jgi:peroxiredoxin